LPSDMKKKLDKAKHAKEIDEDEVGGQL